MQGKIVMGAPFSPRQVRILEVLEHLEQCGAWQSSGTCRWGDGIFYTPAPPFTMLYDERDHLHPITPFPIGTAIAVSTYHGNTFADNLK
jgi:hypothetical protein